MVARTGLQTFLNLAHRFCVFFGRWEASVRAAINASSATPEQKAVLLASIDAIIAACSAVDAIRVTWEG